MTPSIPLGTLLRQRYVIQQILGQGGFSRTYLALDMERFHEPCVLKELAVPQDNQALFDKAKTLFRREASVLYQMQHPQIPRFLAAFEDQERFFSVQEFVDGKTYRSLLKERKKEGKKFSEAEVIQFLDHLLPVLAYIHGRNIIHRDISPENMMLRMRHSGTSEGDAPPSVGLPVLIDFGAVKAVADYISSTYVASGPHPLISTEITRVGKAGYAPPEQLQTGKVYPHSDLYALAATSLVLLTGKEPKSLLDSHTLTWRVQAYAPVSDRFAAILQKMLALRPHERYQSAAEVQADLQPLLQAEVPPTLLNPSVGSAALSIAPPLAPTQQPAERTPENQSGDRVLSSLGRSSRSKSTSPRTARDSWVGASVGLGVAVLLGVVLPLVWRLTVGAPQPRNEVWMSGAKLPQSEASQIIGSNPTGTTSPNPNERPEPIEFPANSISTTIQGNLDKQVLKHYSLRAFQGQIMTVALEGAGVTMSLLNSQRQGIDTAAYQTHNWTGQLPEDDNYIIRVAGSGAYRLEVAITPLPEAAQAPSITLAPQATGTTLKGQTGPTQPKRYRFTAKRGQVLSVQTLQGTVQIKVIAPTGQLLASSLANQPQKWQGSLPTDGSFTLEVSAAKPEKFTLSLRIR